MPNSHPNALRPTTLAWLSVPVLLLAYGGCSEPSTADMGAGGTSQTSAGTPGSTGGSDPVPVQTMGGAAGNGTPITAGSPPGMGGVTGGGGNPPGGGGAAVSMGGSINTGGPACATDPGSNDATLSVRRPEIGTRVVAEVPDVEMMRIEYDPLVERIVAMSRGGQFWTVDPAASAVTPLDTGFPGGTDCRSFTYGPDGAMYVQCHGGAGGISVAISKGTSAGATYTWTTLVTSEPYTAGGTNFDHGFNGIAVSPDNMNVYFGSGSRTDHGEEEAGSREEPITSAVFRVPTTSQDLVLMNDETALAPYLFADGLRNAFDIAFNHDGDLFAAENGPDMDLPDEINFVEEGKHYGFPWRFGDVDNPTMNAAYTATGDDCLHAGYQGRDDMKYFADAAFPAAPGAFTDPLMNHGPDGDKFRVCPTGMPQDASDVGTPLAGITPHKSPAGLEFDLDGALCGDYFRAGFFLTYGAVGDFFQDGGRDLSLMNLTKVGDTFEMQVTQLVAGFEFAPIDGVLVGYNYYVLEYGGGSITEIRLPPPAM